MSFDWRKLLTKTSHTLPRPLWEAFKKIARSKGKLPDELLTEVIKDYLIREGVDIEQLTEEWKRTVLGD